MSCLENLVAFFKFIGNFIKGITIATYYVLKAIVLLFIPKCFYFKDISEDIVLVTGGASGIGRLMAIRFAKHGAKVVIWDLNLAGLEETRKMIEELRSKREKVGKCFHYQVDIADRHKVYAAAERVRQEVGDVSIVVNNAGVVTGRRFLECDDEKILKTFDVNTLAHFWVSIFTSDRLAPSYERRVLSFGSLSWSAATYVRGITCSIVASEAAAKTLNYFPMSCGCN